MIDIESLRFIWWILLGVLIIGFAITDGFDLGIAILFPFIARNETEKNVVLNTIRPFWEGNQVWIILGAGAIFAAWPYVYAVAFSGVYFPILLLLLTLGISRPVSFKYRDKISNVSWRKCWDALTFIGGFVPALLFGVLIGNVLIGLPFRFDDTLRMFYEGSIVDLINPFALWCGLTSIAMLVMQGGSYLAIKTGNPIRLRAITSAKMAAIVLILFFVIGGFWVAYFIPGYSLTSSVDHAGYSNPLLLKEVIAQNGAWMNNYMASPALWLVPSIGILGAILVYLFADKGRGYLAFICSSISVAGVIGTVGVSMFPFILPSSVQSNTSLLVWNASSSQLTLTIMLVGTIIFMPIILLYTAWVYRAMR
jgi:cytochrome bd ubiquinol oxidase subunit II